MPIVFGKLIYRQILIARLHNATVVVTLHVDVLPVDGGVYEPAHYSNWKLANIFHADVLAAILIVNISRNAGI